MDQLRELLSPQTQVLSYTEAREGYWSMLADASMVVVSSDSESMLADAVSSGHPVYIYELPVKPLSRWLSIGQWVLERALSNPQNSRATTRPQQGLEYLCARVIDKGLIRPPRDLNRLHHDLYRIGLALPLRNEPGAYEFSSTNHAGTENQQVAALNREQSTRIVS